MFSLLFSSSNLNRYDPLLVCPALCEIGPRTWHGFLFRREIVRLSNLQQRIIGLSSLAVSQDNKRLIELLEPRGISLRIQPIGQLRISSTDGLLGGSRINLKSGVIIHLISGDCSCEGSPWLDADYLP